MAGERDFVTLGELVKAGDLAVGDGYRAKNEELGSSGPIFLRSAYLQDSGWVLDTPDRLSLPQVAEFGSKVAQLFDTVLTTKGNSLGRLGLVRADVAGAVYSPHLSYWRSRRHDKIDPRFLYYWAHSAEAMHQIKARSESTDMAPYLSLADQLAIRISLPTPARQTAIASLLGSLDDKIELNRRMAATLEDMARALFKSWFVNFDPVRAKAKGRSTGLPDSTDDLFPSRFDENGLPEGWAATAAEIGELIRDSVDPKTLPPDTPYVGLEHIDRRALRLGRFGRAVEVDSLKATFSQGHLLFGKLRPYFHKVAVAPVAGICSTDIFVFKPKPGVPAPYLYLAFSEDGFVAKASGAQNGTRMPRADWGFMKAQVIPKPSKELLGAFDDAVAPHLVAMQAMVMQSRTLEQLRDTLLPKLISGELRIKDVDNAVEAA
jgi:type I restriction enzyme S subunit